MIGCAKKWWEKWIAGEYFRQCYTGAIKNSELKTQENKENEKKKRREKGCQE
jgi:hypothetical protein